MKREIISIHVGQAGIQTANSIWELYCLEHEIDPDGYLINPHQNENTAYESFFERTNRMRYVPRAIFFDTENILIDEITNGPYGQLYHPCQLIKGFEDASSNFARGSFTVSKMNMSVLIERIRKAIENCEHSEGFIITHSLGGGTGSGFTSILMHTLQADYAKLNRIQIPVFPGQIMSTAVVEPYNSLLHIHSTLENVDLSLLFGNEALYELCSYLLFMEHCSYLDINRIISLIVSSSTAPLRYEGQLNTDLGEMQTNLVPYPRIHYPLLRYSPILHHKKTKHLKPTVAVITKDVFSKRYQTIKTDTTNGRYIAVVLNYRGRVSPREVTNIIQTMKMKQEIDFVDWCPTGFKIALNGGTQTVVPESEVANYDYSVSMIANTTSIKDIWIRLSRKYITLYRKKAFVHWFIDEGMEEFEFDDAYDSVLTLIEDYNECGLTNEDIENILSKYKNKESLEEKPQSIPTLKSSSGTNSRLLSRRHSSKLHKAPKKAETQKIIKKKMSTRKEDRKPMTNMEKKIKTHRTPTQALNASLLRAASSVSLTK